MKGAEMYSGSFVAQLDATVVAEPRQRALDHITRFAQAAAVSAAARSQQADDHQADQQFDRLFEAVASVALQCFGPGAFLAATVRQRRELLEHRLHQLFVPL